MSRVVLIVDSDTGEMIDVAGNSREGGRYMAFSKRMLSAEKNPSLDYGARGGDTLTVCSNGGYGKEIRLLSDKVVIPRDLYVKNRKIEEIVDSTAENVLDMIVGTDGEVSVIRNQDIETGKTAVVISIDPSMASRISRISDAVDDMPSGYIGRNELLNAISGISVSEDSTPEDVRTALGLLIRKLNEIAGSDDLPSSEPPSSEPASPEPPSPEPASPEPPSPEPM